MREYSDYSAVNTLTGSPAGSASGGRLTEAVRRKPFAVVLFDDIQYANAAVRSLVQSIMRCGVLTDAKGKNVSFRNAIVFVTCGEGDSFKQRRAGFSDEANALNGSRDERDARQILPPEIASDADCVAALLPAAQAAVPEIAKLMLDDLSDKLKKRVERFVSALPPQITLQAKSMKSNLKKRCMGCCTLRFERMRGFYQRKAA